MPQHCRVAGRSLPNSSNMIRWSGWEFLYPAALGGDLSVPMPSGMPCYGNCMGDEGKAVGIAQAPAALLSTA